jgi:hypothetical protein
VSVGASRNPKGQFAVFSGAPLHAAASNARATIPATANRDIDPCLPLFVMATVKHNLMGGKQGRPPRP